LELDYSAMLPRQVTLTNVKHAGKVLELNDGDALAIKEPSSQPNQMWELRQLFPGRYLILTQAKTCLEIQRNARDIKASACHAGLAQQWIIDEVDDHQSVVRSAQNGRPIKGKESEVAVRVWTNNADQKWIIQGIVTPNQDMAKATPTDEAEAQTQLKQAPSTPDEMTSQKQPESPKSTEVVMLDEDLSESKLLEQDLSELSIGENPWTGEDASFIELQEDKKTLAN
jgi:hypothetical protein